MELIQNGGFETGDFTGWTRFVQDGSPGNFHISDTTVTPAEQFPTVGPNAGSFYAVTDSNAPNTDGPGAYALIQMFTVPLTVLPSEPLRLTFAFFVNDWFAGGALNTGGALDYTQAEPTQFARVDLLTATASPFSTDGADIIRTFYLGNDGDDPPYPYRITVADIAAEISAGQTYQLRFATVSNQFSLNIGVDSVSLIAIVAPEPCGLALLLPMTAFFVAGHRFNRFRIQ